MEGHSHLQPLHPRPGRTARATTAPIRRASCTWGTWVSRRTFPALVRAFEPSPALGDDARLILAGTGELALGGRGGDPLRPRRDARPAARGARGGDGAGDHRARPPATRRRRIQPAVEADEPDVPRRPGAGERQPPLRDRPDRARVGRRLGDRRRRPGGLPKRASRHPRRPGRSSSGGARPGWSSPGETSARRPSRPDSRTCSTTSRRRTACRGRLSSERRGHHRLDGADRLGGRQPLRRPRHGRGRDRQRHAAACSSAPRHPPTGTGPGWRRRLAGATATTPWTSVTATGSTRSSPVTARRSSWSSTPPPSRRTTGRRGSR